MNRFRKLFALLLSFALVLSLSVSASAKEKEGPVLWDPSRTYDLYTVFEQVAERATGKPETMSGLFDVRANVAKLTIVDEGIKNLEVQINGHDLDLKEFFTEKGTGTASLDISGLITYGANGIQIEAKGKPGEKATIKVEAPAFNGRILHTNDIHAAIDNLPKMAAYVKSAKAQGGNVYFVNAGDNFSGNPVSDLNQGRPMIEALNAMQVDLSAVGNHDFDHGPANTQARREESNFPWLSANTVVVDPALTPIQPFEGYKIMTNDLGQKVGFIALTQTPPATGTKNIVGLRFDDPVLVAQRLITELRPQVNVLVLVSHNGHDWDTANAPAFQGADLILGAHSHTNLTEPVYVAGIPIIQVGSGAQNISDLLVRQAEQVAFTPGAAGGAYAVRVATMTDVDPEVQGIVTRWNDQMLPVLNTKIGTNVRNLSGDGGKTANDTGLGNLITDSLRDYMGADFGIWNNGGIRADLPSGDISMTAVYKVMPFGNIPWLVETTGADFVQMLANSYGRRNSIDLQISGATYVVYTKADGSLDHMVVKVNGEPIDPAKTYTLSVSDFIATSASYWSTMPVPIEMSSEVDAIAMADYIRRIGTVDYKASEGRIRISPPTTPVAVTRLNFFNASSLLAADASGALVPLTNQADVLVTGESTAFQFERSTTAPKNFPKVDAGKPIPLAAMQSVGAGKVVASGAMLVANGFRANYQNPQWLTNVLDRLTGTASGNILVDDGHGQFYGSANGNLSQFANFITDRGYSPAFTGPNTALTAARLANVQVLVISSPGSVGVYTADELAVLQAYVAGGGNLILLSQTDFNNNSNPTELNTVAAGIGTVIRFNSDEVRDDASKDGTSNFSPVTNEFNSAYADLLKAR